MSETKVKKTPISPYRRSQKRRSEKLVSPYDMPFQSISTGESGLFYEGHSKGLITRLGGGFERDAQTFVVVPEVDAYDPKWSKVLERVATRVKTELPETRFDGALKTAPGVDHDILSKLATMPGRPMLPLGDPFVFALEQRSAAMEKALASDLETYGHSAKTNFRQWTGSLEERVLEAILNEVWRPGLLTKVRIKNNTNVGLPDCFKSPVLKQDMIDKWAANHGNILSKFMAQDLDGLYREHNIIFCNIAQNRVQADGGVLAPDGTVLFAGDRYNAKPRPAYSIAKREFTSADKLCEIEGVGTRFRERGRPIAAVAINSAIPALYQSHSVQGHIYSCRAFKGRSREEMNFELSIGLRRHFQILDTITSDMNQPSAGLAQIDGHSLDKFGAAGAFGVLPSHAPILSAKGGEGVVVGDPFDPSTFVCSYVIASGDPSTTTKTTVLNACHVVCALVRAGVIDESPETWIRLLKKGLGHVSLFLAGDNMLVATDSEIPDLVPFFRSVPVDKATTIMGYSVEMTPSGPALLPEISNLLTKLWAENECYSSRRRFPAEGFFAQRDNYSAGSLSEDVFSIIDESFKEQFGSTLSKWYQDRPDAANIKDSMSVEAFKLMLDLDKMHYRDIPEEVLLELDNLNVFTVIPNELEDAMLLMFEQEAPDWMQHYREIDHDKS